MIQTWEFLLLTIVIIWFIQFIMNIWTFYKDHFESFSEGTFLHDFLEILNRSFQNFFKFLKECFLNAIRYSLWSMYKVGQSMTNSRTQKFNSVETAIVMIIVGWLSCLSRETSCFEPPLENLKEMFPRYTVYSDVLRRFTSSIIP